MHHFHRSYGKSQFFNFPRVAARCSTWCASGSSWWCGGAPASARPATATAPARTPSDRLPRLLPGPQGPGDGRRSASSARNLCRTLADLGAQVLAVDSLLPDYGGNLFNLAGYEDKVRINIADVRGHGMEYLVQGQDVLFNLAGQVSHIDSMTDPVHRPGDQLPQPALDPGGAAQAATPRLKIVYAGTRQIYGKPAAPAGGREAPAEPDRRERHQQDLGRVVPPRLPLGVRHPRLARCASPTPTARASSSATTARASSAGSCARRCWARRSSSSATAGSSATSTTWTTWSTRSCARGPWTRRTARSSTWAASAPVSLLELAKLMIEIAGPAARTALVPFPPERKRIDIGDFYADTTKIRETLGWAPRIAAARRPRAHHRLLPRSTRSTTCERRDAAVPFVRLQGARGGAARARSTPRVARVLDSGWFILGPEGEAFERELAAALRRAPTRWGWRNGTDAIAARRCEALGVGPGDEVVTSPLTAAFTGARHPARRARARSSPTSTRARSTSAPEAVARAVTPRTQGAPARAPLRPSGRHGPAPGARATRTASRWSRTPARRIGARYKGRTVGAHRAGLGALSFYPTKNLGALRRRRRASW